MLLYFFIFVFKLLLRVKPLRRKFINVGIRTYHKTFKDTRCLIRKYCGKIAKSVYEFSAKKK